MILNRIGLAVDPSTNDLYLDSTGALATVEDAHAVGQHVRQRLKTFAQEWFLDTTAGVPWLTDILGRGYDPALAEAVIKAEILDTDGVTEISRFSVRFDRAKRHLEAFNISVGSEYEQEAPV